MAHTGCGDSAFMLKHVPALVPNRGDEFFDDDPPGVAMHASTSADGPMLRKVRSHGGADHDLERAAVPVLPSPAAHTAGTPRGEHKD